MPSQWYQLHLPRWDTDWRITRPMVDKKTGRPLLNKKTNKPRFHKVRDVWDPLQANARGNHWGGKAKATNEVIQAVAWAAAAQKIPQCNHLIVQLHWAPGDNRRADSDNLYPLMKACCDGLARGRKDLPGLHLVPDDSDEYMTKERPKIVRSHPGGLWLNVVASW